MRTSGKVSTLEYIMNMKILMEYYDELPPGYCNKRAVKEQLDVFISTLKIDCINYEATQQDSHFQLLLSKVHAMEEDERADQKAADVQKAEEKSMEFRLRIQARLLKERVEAAAAVEEAAAAAAATEKSSDQTKVMPLLMELVRETQFPSADKKASDERSADAAEKDKDVEKAEEVLRRARTQANVDAWRLKESKRGEC